MSPPAAPPAPSPGLEAEYNLRARHPDHESVRDGWAAATARTKSSLEWRADLAYGDHPRQRLDLFPATETGGSLLVFIHGGYWRSNDKENYGFIAEPVVAHGGALAVLNYGLAPETPVAEIIAHVQDAIHWLHDNAPQGRFDPEKIHVTGHSAGGHLTAELAATDWRARGLPEELIRSATPTSGLFDLAPLIETSINQELQLDRQAARRVSPLYRLPRKSMAMTIAVGAEETEEFQRQSRDYALRCRASGLASDFLCLEGCNHYTILNQFMDADAALTRATLARMGLV